MLLVILWRSFPISGLAMVFWDLLWRAGQRDARYVYRLVCLPFPTILLCVTIHEFNLSINRWLSVENWGHSVPSPWNLRMVTWSLPVNQSMNILIQLSDMFFLDRFVFNHFDEFIENSGLVTFIGQIVEDLCKLYSQLCLAQGFMGQTYEGKGKWRRNKENYMLLYLHYLLNFCFTF